MPKLYTIKDGIDPGDIKFVLKNCFEEVKPIEGMIYEAGRDDDDGSFIMCAEVSEDDMMGNHSIVGEDVFIVRKENL